MTGAELLRDAAFCARLDTLCMELLGFARNRAEYAALVGAIRADVHLIRPRDLATRLTGLGVAIGIARRPTRREQVARAEATALASMLLKTEALPPSEASHETGGTRAGSSARAEGEGSCDASGGGGGAS